MPRLAVIAGVPGYDTDMRTPRTLIPWVMWTVGVFSYVVAVINRSSLAALGPQAQEHFGIDATILAAFPVIQIAVYAASQIPVGLLLDRFGVSRLLLTGAVLMVIGQATMATVTDLWLVVIARVFVGAGDACVFISVMKLLPEWFPLRRLPTVTQLTGLVGQAGQIVSVLPLSLAVDRLGWASGFLGIAGLALLSGILVLCVLRDTPQTPTLFERTFRLKPKVRHESQAPTTRSLVVTAPPPTEMLPVLTPKYRALAIFTKIRQLLTFPGVRLAFWIHFTLPFAVNVFLFLWGTPFLVGGLGMSPAAAAGILSLTVVASMWASVVLGPISSRFMERRVWITIVVAVVIVLVWTAVIVWPGVPPVWLIIVLVLIMPVGGPVSMIAFEVARSHTPRSFAGFGTGLVNTGGFTATLIVIFCIGLVLDQLGAGTPETYSLGAFRIAFAVQIPVWVIGIVMILIESRKTRAWMARHGRSLR